MMPMTMARKIHSASKRSRRPRDLKAETLVVDSGDACCFSTSSTDVCGSPLAAMGTAWDVISLDSELPWSFFIGSNMMEAFSSILSTGMVP